MGDEMEQTVLGIQLAGTKISRRAPWFGHAVVKSATPGIESPPAPDEVAQTLHRLQTEPQPLPIGLSQNRAEGPARHRRRYQSRAPDHGFLPAKDESRIAELPVFHSFRVR
jgi:hypothetical protein